MASIEQQVPLTERGRRRRALEAIRRERPHLLFLDVRMPELDGFEVLRLAQWCSHINGLSVL
jgi:CheY-like chemotaxis protein